MSALEVKNAGALPRQSVFCWIAMAFATAAFTMSFVSRFAWPPLNPVVSPVLGISFTEGMAYMTAFYMGYVTTQIPGGLLADRFGPRRVLVVALSVQGLATFGMGFIESYQTGFALRVLCGVGAGCIFSSCIKSMVSWFPRAKRGMAIGVVMTGPTIGVAIANISMPVLNQHIGWQAAFKVVGVALIALGGFILAFMKDAGGGAAGPRKSFMVSLKFVFSNRNILFISLAGFTNLWCQIGFGSAANTYMVNELNFDVLEAGRIMMIYGLIGILMPTLAGLLCGWFPGHKRGMLVISHLLMIAAFILFGRVESYSAILLVTSVIGLLMAFTNPIYTIIITDNAGPEWAGAAGGVGGCIYQFGALLCPVAIGLAHKATGSQILTSWLLAGGALIGIGLIALVKNKVSDQDLSTL